MADISRAVAQTERNLAGLHSLGWKGHEAQAHVLLGLAALRTDVPNIEVARTHLSAALPWTSTSTEVETSLRCIELEVELALAEKQEMTALALLERGRVLAECCGFGLFVTRLMRWSGARPRRIRGAAVRVTALALDAARHCRRACQQTSHEASAPPCCLTAHCVPLTGAKSARFFGRSCLRALGSPC
jgi:hypothetical protein